MALPFISVLKSIEALKKLADMFRRRKNPVAINKATKIEEALQTITEFTVASQDDAEVGNILNTPDVSPQPLKREKCLKVIEAIGNDATVEEAWIIIKMK